MRDATTYIQVRDAAIRTYRSLYVLPGTVKAPSVVSVEFVPGDKVFRLYGWAAFGQMLRLTQSRFVQATAPTPANRFPPKTLPDKDRYLWNSHLSLLDTPDNRGLLFHCDDCGVEPTLCPRPEKLTEVSVAANIHSRLSSVETGQVGHT